MNKKYNYGIKSFNGEKFRFVNTHKWKIDAVKDAFEWAKKGNRYRIIDTSPTGVHLAPLGGRYMLYVSQKTYKSKEWKW